MSVHPKFEVSEIEFTDVHKVEKPLTTYKYREWNDNNAYCKRSLLNREVFLASPSDFEDELDCYNPTRYDLLTIEERQQWIKNKLLETHPNWNEEAIERDISHYEKRSFFYDKEALKEFHQQEREEYNQLTGILSLCKTDTNKAMWEKYGDGGKGICYGFNTDNLIVGCQLGSGGDVIYERKLPVIHPFDHFLARSMARIYYKTNDWAFEDEYRIRTFNDANIHRHNRVKRYPDDALTSVTLGYDFNQNEIESVKAILSEMDSKPILYKLIAVETGDFERVTLDY